jgi:hypothetical protein
LTITATCAEKDCEDFPENQKERGVMEAYLMREAAATLRSFYEWAANNYVDYNVTVTKDSYCVDLGAFGEQTMYVELNQEVELDPENIINTHSPTSVGWFGWLADALEAAAGGEEFTTIPPAGSPNDEPLMAVLTRMKTYGNEDEQDLARTLIGVVNSFQAEQTAA